MQRRWDQAEQEQGEVQADRQPQLGHLVTSSGLKPDPDKVEDIQKMPRPEECDSFCGFVACLANILLRLSEIMNPLRQLTRKKKADWGRTNFPPPPPPPPLPPGGAGARHASFYYPNPNLPVRSKTSRAKQRVFSPANYFPESAGDLLITYNFSCSEFCSKAHQYGRVLIWVPLPRPGGLDSVLSLRLHLYRTPRIRK